MDCGADEIHRSARNYEEARREGSAASPRNLARVRVFRLPHNTLPKLETTRNLFVRVSKDYPSFFVQKVTKGRKEAKGTISYRTSRVTTQRSWNNKDRNIPITADRRDSSA